MRLIAEDLLLLLFDDEEGRASGWVDGNIDTALAGAVLAELSLAGAVSSSDPTKVFKTRDVRVSDGDAVEDPVLVDALGTIGRKDRSAVQLVPVLARGLRERLLERLVSAGILEKREDKVLVVFNRTRWPAADAAHETALRRTLTAVLVKGEEPDARSSVIIACLQVLDQVHKVIEHPDTSDQQIKTRAAAVAEGGWATTAVKESLEYAVLVATTVI